jgi:hypothetical protein
VRELVFVIVPIADRRVSNALSCRRAVEAHLPMSGCPGWLETGEG